jgi:Mn2+/Fe2+ NRAMP family transporter
MGAAAFSAMLGTCVAVMDGYARSLSQSLAVALERQASARWGQVALVTVAAGGLALVVLFSGQIKQLVDLATTLSFLVAPLVAFWNLRLVTRPDFPKDARPGRGLQAWAWAGLAFLTAFTLWFLWIQFAA